MSDHTGSQLDSIHPYMHTACVLNSDFSLILIRFHIETVATDMSKVVICEIYNDDN